MTEVDLLKPLGIAPAVRADVEFERWDLEKVVERRAKHLHRKKDEKFEKAFALI